MGILDTDGKMIFIIFLGLIIATAIIAPIANQVVANTQTISIPNTTITSPAAANGTLDLQGRELLTTLTIANETADLTGLGLSLRTATSATTGLRTVQLIANDSAFNFGEGNINVSYTANPDGYVSDSGARAITVLIVLFSALAALVFVIVMLFSGSFGKLVRGS